MKAPRIKPPLEREVQAGIVRLFRTVGLEVWTSSQYRASHVSEGYPDLWVMGRGGRRVAFYFETKRPKATERFNPWDESTWEPEPLSPVQALFRRYCDFNDVGHYWGGLPEARRALVDEGLARIDDGQFILTPDPVILELETLRGFKSFERIARDPLPTTPSRRKAP